MSAADHALPSAAMLTRARQEDEPLAAPTDAELLRRHLAGERAAFERLYDRHDRRCFDFIRRVLAPADDATAEDLHQEVWIAVARQAATFDERKARFVTWLFTIARNKAMDHWRGSNSRRFVCLAADIDPGRTEVALEHAPDSAAVNPERIAQNAQFAAALLREVQALPLAQRETFVLFAQHGLSLDEVADITCVGLETARSRLRYARRTLRARLACWGADHG